MKLLSKEEIDNLEVGEYFIGFCCLWHPSKWLRIYKLSDIDSCTPICYINDSMKSSSEFKTLTHPNCWGNWTIYSMSHEEVLEHLVLELI